MLCVWVHGCDPGRVSDGSRLALDQTLSIECASSIFFWHVCFVLFIVPFVLSFFVLFSCSRWSIVHEMMMFLWSFPVQRTTYITDWQSPTILGMVEARSVDV